MKESDDIAILVEQHAKEIWTLKQELSKASQDLTVLHGTKGVVVSLSNELTRMRKRAQEAEGELTIIKGIGNTSPEMKELRARIKELDNSLAIALEVNEKHQRYNGRLQTRLTEVEEDNKKLSQQVEDKIGRLREKGLI
jgi:predicted  nucleic acid-binding Zn-ribbon protein